jgi:DNA-binding MarR family transcriptional regulator
MDTPVVEDRMESATGFILVKLGGAAGVLFEQAVQSTGMRPRHIRTLGYVQTQGLSQQELCQLTGMDRTTMVSVVDELERLGYARREASSTDRRKRVVTPTPAGLKALVKAADLMKQAEAQLLAPLSATERRQLNGLLGRLFTPELLACDPGTSDAPRDS